MTSPATQSSAALPRRMLPFGIPTFSEMLEEGYFYVDKTGIAVDLAQRGKHYFLSRPWRFGKSLFLSTLKGLLEGNESLFKGLEAESRWNWAIKYPVLRISFGGGVLRDRAELGVRIREILLDNAQRLGAVCTHESIGGRFAPLIAQAHQLTGQRAVVLMDECDKLMLDNIDNSAVATEMREGLKNLFSGLNKPSDITLAARYSDIGGYTEAGVDTVFAPALPGLDRALIRQWHKGYNWLGTPVYNPFGLLLLLDTRKFLPHWFETGMPTFLIKLLQQRQQFTPDLCHIVVSQALLSPSNVGNIPVEALMFQARSLSIQGLWEAPGQMELTLKYPNLEVQAALNSSLLQSLTGALNVPGPPLSRLYKLLQARDFAGLKELFHAFYASIANDWFRKNETRGFKGYDVSIFLPLLCRAGFRHSPGRPA
jgi:hypothetical protein